jgi:hypothetical protein
LTPYAAPQHDLAEKQKFLTDGVVTGKALSMGGWCTYIRRIPPSSAAAWAGPKSGMWIWRSKQLAGDC